MRRFLWRERERVRDIQRERVCVCLCDYHLFILHSTTLHYDCIDCSIHQVERRSVCGLLMAPKTHTQDAVCSL